MGKKFKVLIVDDNPDNIRIFVELLKNDYQLNATTNGFDALAYASSWQPDLILLDIMMPEISGYNVCIQLKSDPETENIPVIFVSALSDLSDELLGLDIGAIDYITKPVVPEHVLIRVKNHIELKTNEDIISGIINYRKEKLDKSDSKYREVFYQFLNKMTGIINYNITDEEHALRCLEYTKIFLKKLMTEKTYSELLTTELSEAICYAALFHIFDRKELNLLIPSEKQIEPMNERIINNEILKSIAGMFDDELYSKTIIDAMNHYHEHWDGKGYPDGLSGNDIPIAARILAIIDFYDRKALATSEFDSSLNYEAITLISSESSMRFDPDLVYLFSQAQEELMEL